MLRRTALITAASIVAVVLAGATAVGANIGILSNASESEVGGLTAVAQVESAEAPVTAQPTPPPMPTATPVGENVTRQSFEADAAGFVEVEFTSEELRLGSVQPNQGWTWSSDQTGDRSLSVGFVNGEDELKFVAELLDDGTITAKVDETIIEIVQGEAEIITVRTQATAAPVTLAASDSATPSPAAGASEPSVGAAAQPSSVPAVPPTAAPAPTSPPAAPTPMPQPSAVVPDDNDHDHDHEDNEDDDEYEDDNDDHEYEDDEEEDEHEGAEDDD